VQGNYWQPQVGRVAVFSRTMNGLQNSSIRVNQ